MEKHDIKNPRESLETKMIFLLSMILILDQMKNVKVSKIF